MTAAANIHTYDVHDVIVIHLGGKQRMLLRNCADAQTRLSIIRDCLHGLCADSSEPSLFVYVVIFKICLDHQGI